jgi:hypothetical protein
VVLLDLGGVLTGKGDRHFPRPCLAQHLVDVHILRDHIIELVDKCKERFAVLLPLYFGASLDGGPNPSHDCC